MNSRMCRYALAGLMLVAMTLVMVGEVSAQCATCPTPTVAFQPVVAQPTVAYRPYTGWYPGKWIDQWRLRRAGVATTAPAYTAAYAPTYRAAYAPTNYTAAYAPRYTAAYRPYVTSFAPLSAPIAAPCNTCSVPVAQTLARPVLMRPVIAAPACNTCSFTPSCGCDACSSGVSQAAYTEPACSSCAGGGTVTSVMPQGSSVGNIGPQTPQPNFSSPEPAPRRSNYPAERSLQGSSTRNGGLPADDDNGNDVDPLEGLDDPGPKTDDDSSTFYRNAPRLLNANGDRTARTYKSRKPTVDVWNAVYRQQATNHKVSQTRHQRPARTQAEIDADGWSAVPRSR